MTVREPRAVDRNVLYLQAFTIGWMCIECSVALIASRRARSSALLAFGSDSFVELLSAAVVLLQYWPAFPMGPREASRSAAVLLFVLCAFVAGTSVLSLLFGVRAESSLAGIWITALALVIMPVVAMAKRRIARVRHDQALAADAVQSATCAYLAGLTLLSLVVNRITPVTWLDSGAALLATPILIIEGLRAWREESCGCCQV